MIKSQKDRFSEVHVDWLVPMSDLWAQCTWMSLTGKTEKGVGRSG